MMKQTDQEKNVLVMGKKSVSMSLNGSYIHSPVQKRLSGNSITSISKLKHQLILF